MRHVLSILHEEEKTFRDAQLELTYRCLSYVGARHERVEANVFALVGLLIGAALSCHVTEREYLQYEKSSLCDGQVPSAMTHNDDLNVAENDFQIFHHLTLGRTFTTNPAAFCFSLFSESSFLLFPLSFRPTNDELRYRHPLTLPC